MKKFFLSIAVLLYSLLAISQNPQLLKDVVPGNNTSGTIAQIVKTSNYTFFNENDGGAATDRSLYRTDGTLGGTVKLNLTYPGYVSTKAEKLTALGNKVIFAGDNFPNYGEIWSSDGTQAGTVAIERFQPTSDVIPVGEMKEMGGFVYYKVVDKLLNPSTGLFVNHTYLKRTDGTVAGTSLIYDFSSYAPLPVVVYFTPLNNILYFIVYDAAGTGVDQLWRSDGTTAGTYMVYDFTTSAFVESLIMPAGNSLYLIIGTIVGGIRQNTLWKSDGTTGGTAPLKLIGTGNTNVNPPYLAIGSNLVFAGVDGNGKELWATDGTVAGTNMVADINPGVANSNPTNFTYLNNRLYFSATTATSGTELWESDGSASGTVLVKDINPGVANSSPSSLVLSNNTILFRATTATEGSELWITDGTASNTLIAADINPGINGSSPNGFTTGNPVYFAANNGVSGFEVFKYENSEGVLGAKKVWLTGAAFGEWKESGVIKLTNNGGGIFTATNIQIIGTGGESSYFKFTEGTWATVAGRSLTTPAPGFPTGVTELSSVTEPQGVDNVITGTPGYWNVVYNYITKAYSFIPTPTDNWSVVGTATSNGWNGPDMPLTYDAISNKWSAVVSLTDGEIKFRNNNDWAVNYGDNDSDGSLDTNGANIAIAGGRYLITLDFNTLTYTIKSALVAIPDSNFEQALIAAGLDTNGLTGNILRSDAEAVTELNVNSKNINSLQGIEAFTNLSKLYCQYNQIQVLDISNNKALTILECGGNQLNQLNVTQNPLLKVLGFGPNNISQIDVSQNLNLEVFWCNNNNITSQNLDLNSKLTVIGLSNNPLTFVSLKNGNNVNVVYFEAYNTPNLACINADAVVSVSMSNSGKTFSENCSTTSLAGSWIVAPETRALKVGPSPGSDLWWYLTQNDIAARACYMDDKYVFDEAGSFKNVLGSETFLETWQGVASAQCGAPVAPHDGSTNATYVYNQNAGTITLNGQGAYLGLPKVANGYELPNGPVPSSITYNVSFSDNGTIMTLSINFGAGFWTYKFIKESALKTYYVNDNSKTGDVFTSAIGSNYNIGTKAAPFETLEYAIARATAGETIYLDAGTYAAQVFTINKQVQIIGTNYNVSPNSSSDPLILNPARNAESIIDSSSWTIGADGISITGLTFIPTGNAITLSNNSFGNITLSRNRVRINSLFPPFVFNGLSTVTTVSQIVNWGLTITDNRFEKEDASSGNTVRVNRFGNVNIYNNSFVVTGITERTQNSLAIGNAGVVTSLLIYNNTFDRAATAINSNSLGSANIYNNKFINTSTAFFGNNQFPESSEVGFRINTLDGSAGIVPFIQYTRQGGNAAGTTSSFTAEENIITGNAVADTTILLGGMNLIFNNTVLSPSVTVRNNKITYGGDLSTIPAHLIRPIMIRGNLANAIVENNEINLTGINQQLPTAGVDFPVSPAITLYTDNGASSFLQSGSVINILNNKINGFKNSFAAYDGTSTGKDAYVGFGNIPAGVTVNINNNSFTGDVMSINNGTQGQEVQASCNWYGSAAVQNIINKVSLQTGTYAPYLTNGTDNDVATGFQPIPGSCNGLPLSATLDNSTNVTCNGANNGTINITVTSGVAPYTFAWTKDNDLAIISTNEDPTNLAPGVYNLTITDASGTNILVDNDGNIYTINVTISEPSLLTATADGINNLCFGESTGTAFVVADGGTTPYTYLWNNGATTDEISNLSVGTYSVTVTDANGCTINASYEVTQPTLLTATITNNSTACSNKATVTAFDGTPGYTYLWSNGATIASIENVPVGTYTVTVTDANGCSTTASITLTVGEAFNPSASVTNVSCFGGSNGAITVTNANGTAPFTFSKDGITFLSGTFPYSFNDLSAGTYNIAVKDANGCTGFVTKTIVQPALLTATLITVQSTCFGQSTGTISVATTGGSGALSYSWTGTGGFTSSQKNINNLAAGSYVLTVTDNNGCTALLDVVVPNFNPITVSETIINVLCRGSLTGAINLTVSGGSGSFAYSWSGSTTSTSKDLKDVGPGTNYKVTITDIASGCVVTKTYVITQPASNLAISTTKTNSTGCNFGTITMTGSGGTAGYTYSIDGTTYLGANTFSVQAGSYTAWVKDANGCTKSSALISITDNGSDAYESNNSKSQAKSISIGATINARIALATDTADWFKFTPTSTGNYKLTITHPTVNYAFNLYPSTNNAAALVPTSPTLTSKSYALTGGLTYYVQITGASSFKCYDLSISTVANGAKYASTNTKVIAVEKLSVKAYPNPHQGLFNLSIISPEDGKAQIELFSILGQLLAKREVSIEKGQNTIVEFNDVGRGIILYHLTIGNQEVNGKVFGKD